LPCFQVFAPFLILSLFTIKNTFFFKIGGSSHMRRSEVRGEKGVISGCYRVFLARGNAAVTPQKQSFRKIKKDENRKKNWKMLKSAK